MKQTSTPRSRLKKNLFNTSRKCSPVPKDTTEKKVVTQVTSSTQTNHPRDFDVKVNIAHMVYILHII